MKNINGHTHWQFGNFSPNKESGSGNKPPEAAEAEKNVTEAIEASKNLAEVKEQAASKIKAAEDSVDNLNGKLQKLEELQGRIGAASAIDSTEEVVYRGNKMKLKDINTAELQTEIDQVKVDVEAAEQALNQEKQSTQAEINKANTDFLQAFSKLSPDQRKAFDKLKAANENAKNAPPGSAQGKNIVLAIIEAILEWFRASQEEDKDKNKNKGKGAQGPKGPNGPKGPENNNQKPPEKQEAPELKAIRKEIEDSDYRTVYDNADTAMNNAKNKLDGPPNPGLRKKLANQGSRAVDLQKDIDDAKTALDANPTDPTLKGNLDMAEENLRHFVSNIEATKKELAHQENEYNVNKAKVDLMDGAKEVAEKEADEINKGLKRLSNEIGATPSSPNEKIFKDALDNNIRARYKSNSLDKVGFPLTKYVEAEWDKVKLAAKDMGLDSTAFEVDDKGAITNPERFTSELLAVAQNLDADAEGDLAKIREMTDANVDQATAESAHKMNQQYGVEFKVDAGRVQVEGGADNTKKAFLAYNKEGGKSGTSLDQDVIIAVKDHIESALADITTPEGRAVVEAAFVPNTAKAHDQIVKLGQDPEMGDFKSRFTIDDAGVFFRPPTPDFKGKIVKSELYINGNLDPQILAMYS